MKTFITTIGFEHYGPANAIWLAMKLKDFKPDVIYLLHNNHPSVKKALETNMSLLKEILPEVEIKLVEFVDGVEEFRDAFSKVLEEAQGEIAIDTTPGRKYCSIISYGLGIKNNVKHLFYVHIDNVEQYKNKPYNQIPITHVNLIDLLIITKK